MCKDSLIVSDMDDSDVAVDLESQIWQRQQSYDDDEPDELITPDDLFEAFFANIQRHLWRSVLNGERANRVRLEQLNGVLSEWKSEHMTASSSNQPVVHKARFVHPTRAVTKEAPSQAVPSLSHLLAGKTYSKVNHEELDGGVPVPKLIHSTKIDWPLSREEAPASLIAGIRGFGMYDRFRQRRTARAALNQHGKLFKRICFIPSL